MVITLGEMKASSSMCTFLATVLPNRSVTRSPTRLSPAERT